MMTTEELLRQTEAQGRLLIALRAAAAQAEAAAPAAAAVPLPPPPPPLPPGSSVAAELQRQSELQQAEISALQLTLGAAASAAAAAAVPPPAPPAAAAPEPALSWWPEAPQQPQPRQQPPAPQPPSQQPAPAAAAAAALAPVPLAPSAAAAPEPALSWWPEAPQQPQPRQPASAAAAAAAVAPVPFVPAVSGPEPALSWWPETSQLPPQQPQLLQRPLAQQPPSHQLGAPATAGASPMPLAAPEPALSWWPQTAQVPSQQQQQQQQQQRRPPQASSPPPPLPAPPPRPPPAPSVSPTPPLLRLIDFRFFVYAVDAVLPDLAVALQRSSVFNQMTLQNLFYTLRAARESALCLQAQTAAVLASSGFPPGDVRDAYQPQAFPSGPPPCTSWTALSSTFDLTVNQQRFDALAKSSAYLLACLDVMAGDADTRMRGAPVLAAAVGFKQRLRKLLSLLDDVRPSIARPSGGGGGCAIA